MKYSKIKNNGFERRSTKKETETCGRNAHHNTLAQMFAAPADFTPRTHDQITADLFGAVHVADKQIANSTSR